MGQVGRNRLGATCYPRRLTRIQRFVQETSSMSDTPQETVGSPIRFDRAEFEGASIASRCAVCSEPLAGSYFEINGAMVCPPCRAKVEVASNQGSKPGRVLRALVA